MEHRDVTLPTKHLVRQRLSSRSVGLFVLLDLICFINLQFFRFKIIPITTFDVQGEDVNPLYYSCALQPLRAASTVLKLAFNEPTISSERLMIRAAREQLDFYRMFCKATSPRRNEMLGQLGRFVVFYRSASGK